MSGNADELGIFGRLLARATGAPSDDHPLGGEGFSLVVNEKGLSKFWVKEQGLLRVDVHVQITEETKWVCVSVWGRFPRCACFHR